MIDDLLPRYYEVMGRNPTYTTIRSFDNYDEVDSRHEVAWMEFTGTDFLGEPFVGRQLHCECHFTEGVGFGLHEGKPVRLGGDDECWFRDAAMCQRYLELRNGYGDRVKDLEHVVFDLIAKKKAGELLEDGSGAEFYGGYFYVETLVDVCEVSYPEAWAAIRKLVDEKKISLEGAIVQDYRDPPPPTWDEYARINQGEFVGIASLPSHRQMSQVWKLEVFRNGAIVRTEDLPLSHPTMFGPDAEDVANAEQKLGQLLAEAATVAPN